MDPDTEVESILRQGNQEDDDEEEKKKKMRPPSSYGSMKSDSEDMDEEEEYEEEDKAEENTVAAVAVKAVATAAGTAAGAAAVVAAEKEKVAEEAPVVFPDPTTHQATGMQLYRSDSPETLCTMTTQQRPVGGIVIETGSSDLEYFPEDIEEDMDVLITNSPEPPEPIEQFDGFQNDVNGQPGTLHPEQALPHVFKNIQSTLTRLSREDLYTFKMWVLKWEEDVRQHVIQGDILDFVDKLLEVAGVDRALIQTTIILDSMKKKEEAEELRINCKRVLIRYQLRQYLIRKYQVIREGVIRAGKQNLLETVFVEPQISKGCYGGVDPSHEFRSHPPGPPLQVPSPDTFVGVNNLFRLQKEDGSPVRTLLTSGIPGIGMSVCMGKFCLDWAEEKANRDMQFIIKISFRTLWLLRNSHLPPSKKMSMMEVIEYYNPECKDMTYLDEEDCRFLFIMDSFDCYQAPLDWENAPVINDNHTQAHPDVLIVNMIRGTVLRGACIWILGRQAAVSQIPSRFIDAVTEIQGFSNEMKDDYLSRRFQDGRPERNIVAHYKRLPTLHMLCKQPFVCWMVATVFERCYRYQGYGVHPPRLTPFYVNILIVQINRRLQFYYGISENDLKWTNEEKHLLTKMAKMAFKMLEKNTSVFFEEDVKEHGLKLTEVTVFSGLCTELPTAADGRRTFCFIHFTFQEFMAALYVFTMFRTEAKNVLDSFLQMPKLFASKDHTKSAAGLVQCALTRTFASPLGDYDMFLRFLCGLLSPDCHDNQLCGYLFRHNSPKVGGLEEAQRLLQQTIETAPADRVPNLQECLREMMQEDE